MGKNVQHNSHLFKKINSDKVAISISKNTRSNDFNRKAIM